MTANTFRLADSAEATARILLDRGQPAKALALTRRLLARPEAVGTTAARLHRLAAHALVALARFAAARRHLMMAYRRDTTDAETAYQLGLRFETDDDGSPDRAATWFRRAVRGNSRHARFLAAYARAACRVGKKASGIKAATRAVELAPGDAAVLAVVVETCRTAGRVDLAKRWIDRARFLAPRDAAVTRLWDRVRFDLSAEGQRRGAFVPERRIVPFLRIVGDDRVPVRRDDAATYRPMLRRLPKSS
jgi:tetratricopeptide (TPR) repeat protein